MNKCFNLKSIVTGLLTICGVAVGGCQVMSEKSIDHPFDGIAGAMKPGRITCVLFVHGMGGYSNGTIPGAPNEDPAGIITAFLKLPTIRAVDAAHQVPMDDGAATLIRQDFVDTSNNTQLRTYKLDWEPITGPLKTQYLGYDTEDALMSKRVNLVGGNLRKGILDGAVPDVVLYVGHYKPVIQRGVRQALRRMHQDIDDRDANQDYDYVFVTWSLGSKIVFDCLADPVVTAPKSAGPTTEATTDDVTFNKIARKTRAVYMLANQLPLLSLGDVEPPDQAQPMPYKAMLSVAHRRRMATSEPTTSAIPVAASKLQVVAFSDPNDLLSYPLPPTLQSDDATFSNVPISIVKTAVYIPFLGWVYNPETAHTGYAINDDVVDLILNGSKADSLK